MPGNFDPFATRGNNGNVISINTKKIYDSCASKDYLENLRCYLTDPNQKILEKSSSVKIKDISILDVFVNLEPLQFRRGFFSIDEIFFFEVSLESLSLEKLELLNALCIFSKNIILFGSESDIKTFDSSSNGENKPHPENLPKAIVQVSKPVILSSSLNNVEYSNEIEKISTIPEKISKHFGGDLVYLNISKYLSVTFGLFTITHLERDVQLPVSSCEFVKPLKECNTGLNSEEAFKQMQFPMNNFFPPEPTANS